MLRTEEELLFVFFGGILIRMLKKTEDIFQFQDAQDGLIQEAFRDTAIPDQGLELMEVA